MDELHEALTRRDRASDELSAAIGHLHEVLREIMRAPGGSRHGLKKSLAERTGYTRTHLRRIELEEEKE